MCSSGFVNEREHLHTSDFICPFMEVPLFCAFPVAEAVCMLMSLQCFTCCWPSSQSGAPGNCGGWWCFSDCLFLWSLFTHHRLFGISLAHSTAVVHSFAFNSLVSGVESFWLCHSVLLVVVVLLLFPCSIILLLSNSCGCLYHLPECSWLRADGRLFESTSWFALF